MYTQSLFQCIKKAVSSIAASSQSIQGGWFIHNQTSATAMYLNVPMKAVLFTMVLMFSVSGYAAQFTYSVSGDVVAVEDPLSLLSGQVIVGDKFDGAYSLDDSVTDESPLTEYGVYIINSPPSGLYFRLSGLSFVSDDVAPYLNINVQNDNIGQDDLTIESSINQSLISSLLPAAEFHIERILIHLNDPTESALVNDSIPVEFLDLAQWQSALTTITGCTVDAYQQNGFCPYGANIRTSRMILL